MTVEKRHNLYAIGELLKEGFTIEALRGLFAMAKRQGLHPVADEFTPEDGKPAMIRKAVKYCQAQLLLDELLAEVKEVNGRAYAKYEGQLFVQDPSSDSTTSGDPTDIRREGRDVNGPSPEPTPGIPPDDGTSVPDGMPDQPEARAQDRFSGVLRVPVWRVIAAFVAIAVVALAVWFWPDIRSALFPTPTAVAVITPSSTPTTELIPTSTGTATSSPTFTFTPTSTSTPTATSTPTHTSTPTPTATDTPTPTPTDTFTPTPTPTFPPPPVCLLVANFDDNSETNKFNALGGEMGGASDDKTSDTLTEFYVPEDNRGKVVRIKYSLDYWGGFWLKLNHVDLTPYSRVVFDIRADPQPQAPGQIKLELKRVCYPTGEDKIDCDEWDIAYRQEVSDSWQTFSVPFSKFAGTGFPNKGLVSNWGDMQQLVFTIERVDANGEETGFGNEGVLFLDRIRFCE